MRVGWQPQAGRRSAGETPTRVEAVRLAARAFEDPIERPCVASAPRFRGLGSAGISTRRRRESRWSITIVVCAIGVVVAVLVARRITSTDWPLEGARIDLALAAGAAYLASFVFRALGWQQLFPSASRPDRSRCLAACGAAAASGVVLPFRLDYLVEIATLRRLGGVTVGLEAIAVSILSLGLVDAVAMLPLAIAAFATAGAIFRAPLAVVLLFLPRLHRSPGARAEARTTAADLALEPPGRDLPPRRRQRRAHARDLQRRRVPRRVLVARALGNALLLCALGLGLLAHAGTRRPLHVRRGVDPADHRRRRGRRRRRDVGGAARARRANARGRELRARLEPAPDEQRARSGRDRNLRVDAPCRQPSSSSRRRRCLARRPAPRDACPQLPCRQRSRVLTPTRARRSKP